MSMISLSSLDTQKAARAFGSLSPLNRSSVHFKYDQDHEIEPSPLDAAQQRPPHQTPNKIHDLVANQLQLAQEALHAEHVRALNILCQYLQLPTHHIAGRSQVVQESLSQTFSPKPSKRSAHAIEELDSISEADCISKRAPPRHHTVGEALASSISLSTGLQGRGKSITEASPRNYFAKPPTLTAAPGGIMHGSIAGYASEDSQKKVPPSPPSPRRETSEAKEGPSGPPGTMPDADVVTPPTTIGPHELHAIVPPPSGDAPQMSVGAADDEWSRNESCETPMGSANLSASLGTVFGGHSGRFASGRGHTEGTMLDGEPLEVLAFWMNHHSFKDFNRSQTGFKPKHQRSRTMGKSVSDPRLWDVEASEDVLESDYSGLSGRCRWYVIMPNSALRTTWDLMSLLIVSYDIWIIPMRFFEMGASTFFDIMVWLTRLFWTTDMCLSFRTAFVKSTGDIEARPAKIVRRYLKTWFLLDMIIVLSDWLELIWSGANSGGFARMGRASRILRFVRIVRLLRLLRLSRVLQSTIERIQSEVMTIFANIVRIIMSILCMAHIFGCIWYGIGVLQDSADTWLQRFDADFEEKPLGFRYTCSLHWSLSQFSGGMDEMVPTTTLERVYTLVVYILFYITAVVFVSGLTAAMTRLDMLSSEQESKLSVLRQYLRSHKVPKRVAVRVQINAKHMLELQRRYVPEGKVELLTIISQPLRVEIHFQAYSAALILHPFFERYIHYCPAMMRQACHNAIQPAVLSKDDVIFSVGEIPSHPAAYIVMSGLFSYIAIDGDMHRVTNEMWLAEAALWTHWCHRGTCAATTESQLLHLDTHLFQKTVKQFEHPDFTPTPYAKAFVQKINDCRQTADDLFSAKEVHLDFSACMVRQHTSRWTLSGGGAGFEESASSKGIPGNASLATSSGWAIAKNLVKSKFALMGKKPGG